ncbi:hypothetical protein WG66_007385 [Moniliophthora roreri]|nr:hypothetical protein WG66_007385 [Moniliophthora roreri]
MYLFHYGHHHHRNQPFPYSMLSPQLPRNPNATDDCPATLMAHHLSKTSGGPSSKQLITRQHRIAEKQSQFNNDIYLKESELVPLTRNLPYPQSRIRQMQCRVGD